LATGAATVAGTYTDLGTDGTVITTADFDDATSAPVNIGFTFNYNGASFTQFVLNTNGFIKLGATNPSMDALFGTAQSMFTSGALASTDPADVNIISVFNHDLIGAAGAEYRVYTSGTPGSQVCTIQFKNLTEKTTTPAVQFDNMEFQIKLYEGTNVIEFVYGNFVASANTGNFKASGTGVKGASNTEIVRASKFSGSAWSTTTFMANLSPATNGHNFRNIAPPDAGRTYRFTPASSNDARVADLYTLGNLPAGFGVPHTVRALIRNNGVGAINGLAVTLDISGANTFTDVQTVNIPAGSYQLVSFAAFTPVNAGENTVTVTIPADDNNTNNSSSYRQVVNTNIFGYADTSAALGSIGYNTAQGLILCKYTTSGTTTVTNVNVSLSGGTTVGQNLYAVVLNSAGVRIGYSDTNYVVTNADTIGYKSFVIISPPDVSNSSFYVGIAQKAGGMGYYPVRMQVEVDTMRTDAYYIRGLYGGAVQEVKTFDRFMIEAVVTNSVGVAKTNRKDNTFAIYPNPAKDQLNIRLTDTGKNVRVNIFDITGKNVKSIQMNNASELSVVNISDLEKGTYLIEIAGDQDSKMGRFSKE
jgi:trimeric autotransporter adhesin